MSWVAAIGVGGSLIGGLMGKDEAKDQRQAVAQMTEEDRKFTKEGWEAALRANRVNQYNPFGGSEWVQDEKGNWVQRQFLNPAEQSRLDDFRQIAANRMAAGGGINLGHFGQGADYNSIGLGYLSKAAGVQPNAGSDYRSSGGDRTSQIASQLMRNGPQMPGMYQPMAGGSMMQGGMGGKMGKGPVVQPPMGGGMAPGGGNPSAPPPMVNAPIVPGAGGQDAYKPGAITGPSTPAPTPAAQAPGAMDPSQQEAMLALLRREMDDRAEKERMRLIQEEHNRSGGA